MSPRSDRGLSRREFVTAAVAIGGSTALTACLNRGEQPDLPQGPDDLSTLPARQHAWNDELAVDEAGNTLPPRHRVLLYLQYTNDGPPTDADRTTVETALQGLEHAYPRRHDGLLFTVSYSPTYFDRFDASLPASVDLPQPAALAPFEEPTFDHPDAVLHLASDYGSVVLAAEEALFGKQQQLNGIEMPATLTDVFETIDRRTGFVGAGLPAKHQDVEGIPDSQPVPEEAPLYMGFKSAFTKNQASEDRVTIRSGPFTAGTTQQISTIKLHLNQWYEQDSRFQRVGKMFCPAHAEDDVVEGVGQNLGTSSKMDNCEPADETAREMGMVGHSQKSFRAREDGQPIMLRRDFNSTDGEEAGLHFLSLQRTLSDFIETRKAMNGTNLAERSAVGQTNNNGILQYMTVTRRGNYLIPPRSLRSLPTPQSA
jgi:hypothetical protein